MNTLRTKDLSITIVGENELNTFVVMQDGAGFLVQLTKDKKGLAWVEMSPQSADDLIMLLSEDKKGSPDD